MRGPAGTQDTRPDGCQNEQRRAFSSTVALQLLLVSAIAQLVHLVVHTLHPELSPTTDYHLRRSFSFNTATIQWQCFVSVLSIGSTVGQFWCTSRWIQNGWNFFYYPSTATDWSSGPAKQQTRPSSSSPWSLSSPSSPVAAASSEK